MTQIVGGQRAWSGSRDFEGHRTYKLHVQTVGTRLDGPAAHMTTPGLPLPGSQWIIDGDNDPWAWCTGEVEITPRNGPDEASTYYDHVYTYTTRPRGQRRGMGGNDDKGRSKKCSDMTIQDPLSEPPRTSGGSIRYTEEAQADKDGLPIINTAFEPITGPPVEFDKSRGQVIVEQNVINLDLLACKKMIDTVNDATLWDLPARCWKLSEFHWERKLYGTCGFYYTRRFVFESNVSVVQRTITGTYLDGTIFTHAPGAVVSGWDRNILDFAGKALYGQWVKDGTFLWKYVPISILGVSPDYRKAAHYAILRDPSGKGVTRLPLSHTVRGVPTNDPANDTHVIRMQKYTESNFLTLGIPTVL